MFVGVVAENGSVPIGEAEELPIVALPAPLNFRTYPDGNVFAVRYSLTAQPDAEPVPSSTSSVGFVPPLQVVTVADAEHDDRLVADALAHWS